MAARLGNDLLGRGAETTGSIPRGLVTVVVIGLVVAGFFALQQTARAARLDQLPSTMPTTATTPPTSLTTLMHWCRRSTEIPCDKAKTVGGP